MADSSLQSTAVNSVIWTTIQKFSSVLVGFVSSIILARLLTPEDYGCIGMLSIFMVVSAAFIEGGFGSALVQKKRPTHEDYTTVFYWNIFISTLCYIILFIAAPYIALYYHMPILSNVLRVQGVTLIISALTTVHVSQMYKQFRFKKIAVIYLINTSITLPVTIWMAYSGWGVWTLVYSNIINASITAIIYWTTDKWWPLLSFSVKSFKELFGFGSYILAASLFTQIIDNIQGLFIGRIYDPARMGYYSKANSTQQLATTTILQVVSQVSFPLFSELQDNRERLVNALKRLNTLLAFITFPLVMLLIVLATPIFIILYSEKWIDCVPYFQILCLSGLTICLQSGNGQVIKSLGLSKVSFRWSIINNIVGVALIVLGMFLGGIMGMLIGMVLKNWFAYFAYSYLISKHIQYGVLRQLKDLAPLMIASLVAALASYLYGLLVPSIGLIPDAIIQFVIFAISYMIVSKIICKDVYADFIGITKPIIHKLIRKK